MENKSKINIVKIFFIVLLILIILLSVTLNIFFFIKYINNNNSDIKTNNNNSNDEYIDSILPNNTSSNTNAEFISNTTIDLGNTTKPINQISTSTIIDLTNDNQVSTAIDTYSIDELKTLIEQYSVGIQRIDYQYENLESNTILLFIAKKFFDTNSSKSSLKADTKYASTATNFHKYLSELTGKRYKDIEFINSFTDYIGYSKINRAYVLGVDSSIITDEEYTCTAIEVVDKQDDLYTAKAIISRKANDVNTIYQVTFTFRINSEYEYQKYQIIDFNAVNSSFYPDNTVHLIAN